MIKHINKQNLLTTPFVAAKSWDLYNVNPQELVLTELTGSEEDVALEYVDYTVDPPSLNRDCNIALEQQSSDRAIIEEGISGSGTFLPNSEIVNPRTNTFKRLVYDQTQKAFYNSYRNPLEIFGMDNIDFPLGRTNRFIADRFIMFTIPTSIFGERMKENTIRILDDTFDDNLVVSDDGYGNLIAGTNLFSKVQEVRHFANLILDGTSSVSCPGPFAPAFAPVLSAAQVGFNLEVNVEWTYSGDDQTDFLLERSLDGGTTWPGQFVISNPLDTSYSDTDVSVGQTVTYRISAHNTFGYGPLSNTDSVLIQDAPPACTFNTALNPNKYQIQGYFDGLFQNTGSIQLGRPNWDGVFNFYLHSPFTGWAADVAQTYNIQDRHMCNMAILWLGCDEDDNQIWQVKINNGGFDPGGDLWVGEKIGGVTPEGVYTQIAGDDGGIDTSPATVTVELAAGTAVQLAGQLFCDN